MKDEKTCEHCKFWKSGFDNRGECRFNPPTVLLLDRVLPEDEDDWVTAFPSTAGYEWCRKFKRKKEK